MTAPDAPHAPEELLAHRQWLVALARRLVHDDATAQDLVQDTWVTALETPPRESGSLRSWLGRVLRNRVLQRARSEGRRAAREADSRRTDPMPAPDEVVARSETQRRVLAAVLALEEPYRGVVLLRYYEERSAREIAKHLGLPLETIRTRLKRGVQQLRGALDREYGERRKWHAALLPLFGMPVSPPSGTAPTAVAARPLSRGLRRLAPIGVAGVCAVLTVMALRASVTPSPESKNEPDSRPLLKEAIAPSTEEAADRERRRSRRQARRAQEAAEAPPVDPRSLSAIHIVVRCVQDASPVPGLILDWEGRRPEEDERITTGVGGTATVPTDALHNLISRSSSWALLDPSRTLFTNDGVVWALRLMRVRGRVEDADGNVPSAAKLRFTLRDPRGRPDLWSGFTRQICADAPKTIRNEVHTFMGRPIPPPRADGTFLWRLPHLRWLSVDPGREWRRDAFAVPYDRDPGRVPELVIRLVRWPVLEGVVVGPEGVPVVGASVCIALTEPSGGDFRYASRYETETDEEGRFSLTLMQGPKVEPYLSVHPRHGLAPVRRRLGALGKGLRGLEIRVYERASTDEVLWRSPDGPVSPGLVSVTDVTGDWPHVRFWIEILAGGRSDASALEPGRTYEVTRHTYGRAAGIPPRFTWRGKATIRLERVLDAGVTRDAEPSQGEKR